MIVPAPPRHLMPLPPRREKKGAYGGKAMRNEFERVGLREALHKVASKILLLEMPTETKRTVFGENVTSNNSVTERRFLPPSTATIWMETSVSKVGLLELPTETKSTAFGENVLPPDFPLTTATIWLEMSGWKNQVVRLLPTGT